MVMRAMKVVYMSVYNRLPSQGSGTHDTGLLTRKIIPGARVRRFNDGGDWLPLGTITFWKEAVLLNEKERLWRQSIKWLDLEEDKARRITYKVSSQLSQLHSGYPMITFIG